MVVINWILELNSQRGNFSNSSLKTTFNKLTVVTKGHVQYCINSTEP